MKVKVCIEVGVQQQSGRTVTPEVYITLGVYSNTEGTVILGVYSNNGDVQ